MTHQACLAYPEWIKDRKTSLFNAKDDELDKEAAAAAAMIPAEELVGNDDE